MKITIAHLPEEEQEAAADLAALRQLHPGIKVRKSDAHPPFKHIYLTTKQHIGKRQIPVPQGFGEKEGTPRNGRSRKETT